MKNTSLSKLLRSFFPLFAVSAFLPFLLFFAMNRVDYDISSRANQESILRVWYEPSSVVLDPGEVITMQLMANFENEEEQVHTVSVPIPLVKGLMISTTEIKYTPPFRGKVTLGEVEVTAVSPGKYSLTAPESGIQTSNKELKIVSSPALIEVTN